ncbi:MAG: GatB/YqeY domain-containing protein [Patescibacteria group bacterium]
MTLKQKIGEDIKFAQKAGDSVRLGVLRFVSAQIHNQEIEKRTKSGEAELTDAEVIQVLQREAKKRREAMELFKKGGREDLANQDAAGLKIIESYLPPPVDRSALDKAAEEIIASGERNFGAVMRKVTERFCGQADGKLVAEIVKAKLGGN